MYIIYDILARTQHIFMLLGGTRDTGVAAKPADLPEGLSIHHSIHQTLSQSHDKNMEKAQKAILSIIFFHEKDLTGHV